MSSLRKHFHRKYTYNSNNNTNTNTIICCLILFDTLALCTHQKKTKTKKTHQLWVYNLTPEQIIQIKIYFVFTPEEKKCLNMLIVYWMSYFHCNVLWYLSLYLCKKNKNKQKTGLIMWYPSIQSTWCSSMYLVEYFTRIKP